MKQYTAHIISHTHWDREWYLNSSYTNEWLIPFFDNLFAMLDSEPEYRFVLDGQTAMVEDYFGELKKARRSISRAKRRIRFHVKRGALFLGPYFLQPDWQLLSEEALARNLLIGEKLARELGGSMKSGWLLDNFGQIAQTAQIHRLAGIDGLFVWRGVEMDPRAVKSEFTWESPDGTRIPAVYLLNSYRNVMRLAEYQSIVKSRMSVEVEKLKPFAGTSHLLMMNGYDQEILPDDIQPLLRAGVLNGEDYRGIQSDPDTYIRAVIADGNGNSPPPRLSGALYSGRFISVFPGVMSSRMYLKIENDRLQKLLEKKAEPLSVMAWLAGGEYGSGELETAWKTLLLNHPHDSICGVSIDDVHRDMENRGALVDRLASHRIQEALSCLAGAIDTRDGGTATVASAAPPPGGSASEERHDEGVIVFNTAPRPRSGVIHVQGKPRFVKDVPAMGWAVLGERDSPGRPVTSGETEAGNGLVRISFNPDGSFSLDFAGGRRSRGNLGHIEDMGDCGDCYDYSYPDRDRRITTEGGRARISLERSCELEAVFRVERILELPVGAVENRTMRSGGTAALPTVTYVALQADSPVVRCRTLLKNTVKDHRMRVLIPTGIDAAFSWAGSPFDITKRPVKAPDYDDSRIPEALKKVIVGAREAKPGTIFHNREFVDLNDGSEGLAVFNKGLPEYQILDGGTIALTLFRSVDRIAGEINTRIGDAGPDIRTPDAQCLREMCFEYALCPHVGNAYSGISRLADHYNSDFIVAATEKSPGVLPGRHSFFALDDAPEGDTPKDGESEERDFEHGPHRGSLGDFGSLGAVKITALKRSESGDALICRGVNLSERTARIRVSPPWDTAGAELVNLLEDPMDADLRTPGISPMDADLRAPEIFPMDAASRAPGIFPIEIAAKRIFTLKLSPPFPIKPAGVSPTVCILEEDEEPEDFSEFPSMDPITEEDIQNENNRAEMLGSRIEDPLYRRTALEARLSAILLGQRRDERIIRELGYELNEARVQRRIHDYLT